MQLNEIHSCEVCGSDSLHPVLDLGMHPLCDDLVSIKKSRQCQEYPIQILFCDACKTAHQRFQVPKTSLFPSSYHYRSRFTADVLAGMSEFVETCERQIGALEGKTVLDVGCNDGSLLDLFRMKGMKCVGVEPTAASLEAKEKGHAIIDDYFTEAVAEKIRRENGDVDLITFTNVFAHIENLPGLLTALKEIMNSGTLLVIENHYLGSILERNQFDSFYHEHPRTYGATSFLWIASSLGMSVLNLEFPSRYGGNIRVFLGHSRGGPESRDVKLKHLCSPEKHFRGEFVKLANNVKKWQREKRQLLDETIRNCGTLRAKAFPGRAAILVKLLGLTEEQISAVYEKPGSPKIGHFVPGTRIPIRSDDELFNLPDKGQTILNLAWHISQEIREYLSVHNFHGRVIDILSDEDFSGAG